MNELRSEKNLAGVHPDLVRVVRKAWVLQHERNDGLDFIVTEGLRTRERQAQLLKAGATRTLNSKHITGHAVDLAASVDGGIRWDWPLYDRIATVMRLAAQECGVTITWGGDWKSFKDGPHFEIDPAKYPQ